MRRRIGVLSLTVFLLTAVSFIAGGYALCACWFAAVFLVGAAKSGTKPPCCQAVIKGRVLSMICGSKFGS